MPALKQTNNMYLIIYFLILMGNALRVGDMLLIVSKLTILKCRILNGSEQENSRNLTYNYYIRIFLSSTKKFKDYDGFECLTF